MDYTIDGVKNSDQLIGALLRKERESRGLTIQNVVDRAAQVREQRIKQDPAWGDTRQFSISVPGLSRIELGDRIPTLTTLMALSDGLGVDFLITPKRVFIRDPKDDK